MQGWVEVQDKKTQNTARCNTSGVDAAMDANWVWVGREVGMNLGRGDDRGNRGVVDRWAGTCEMPPTFM